MTLLCWNCLIKRKLPECKGIVEVEDDVVTVRNTISEK